MSKRVSMLFVVMLGYVLSSCGDVPRPFSHAYVGQASPLAILPEAAGVTVPPVQGLSTPLDTQVAARMVLALREAGVPAVAAGQGRGYMFRGVAGGDGVGWALSAPDGVILATVLQSGDRDEREVAAAAVPFLEKDAGGASGRVSAAAAAAGQQVVRVLVRGLPDVSAHLLRQALEGALRRSGVPVAGEGEVPSGDGVMVTGVLSRHSRPGKATADGKGMSIVHLSWHVTDSGGRELGTVTQKNTVPDAVLDERFAPLAVLIAQGGSAGILEILQKPPIPG